MQDILVRHVFCDVTLYDLLRCLLVSHEWHRLIETHPELFWYKHRVQFHNHGVANWHCQCRVAGLSLWTLNRDSFGLYGPVSANMLHLEHPLPSHRFWLQPVGTVVYRRCHGRALHNTKFMLVDSESLHLFGKRTQYVTLGFVDQPTHHYITLRGTELDDWVSLPQTPSQVAC